MEMPKPTDKETISWLEDQATQWCSVVSITTELLSKSYDRIANLESQISSLTAQLNNKDK